MSTDLTTSSSDVSMTSLDISSLVESRHDSVKRTIERLADQGVIEFPPTVEISTATKPVSAYRFFGKKGKRDSTIVVAQLSPAFTARLVDRWEELEEQVRVLPSTEEMEARILASVMEQVKPLLDAPKQTRKRLPAPKKEFLPVDMLAQRHKLHLLLPAVGSMHFSYQDVAMYVLREQGLAEGTFIAPAPTEKAKGQYRLTRGRSPKLEWDADDFKRAAEKTFNRTL